jgi:hypothetical protein
MCYLWRSLFYYRPSQPEQQSAAGRIRDIENFNEHIWNRTRQLLAYNTMPQPTTLQPASTDWSAYANELLLAQCPEPLWRDYMDAESFRAESRTGFLFPPLHARSSFNLQWALSILLASSTPRIQYVSVQPSIAAISTLTFGRESAILCVPLIQLSTCIQSVISVWECNYLHHTNVSGGQIVPQEAVSLQQETTHWLSALLMSQVLGSCKVCGFHGGNYEEYRLLGYKNPVRTSQETHYVSATEPNQLMLCKISCFHGGDYEEYRLLGYKNSVRTSQETHYVSATESSQLMLCKIWSIRRGDYEECRLLGQKNSLYLTGDTLRLRYRAQPVNAMYDLKFSRR